MRLDVDDEIVAMIMLRRTLSVMPWDIVKRGPHQLDVDDGHIDAC